MAVLPIEYWEPEPFGGAPAYTPTADNDLYSGRITLSGESGSVTGISMATATSEADEQAWHGDAVRNRWYVFTAPSDGTYRFVASSVAEPTWYWNLIVWRNDDGVLDLNSDWADWLEDGWTDVAMLAGDSYVLELMSDSSQIHPTDAVLTWSQFAAGVPSQTNDAFASRLAVDSIPTGAVEYNEVYNLAGFSTEAGEGNLAGTRSAWWVFGASLYYAGQGSAFNSTPDHGGMTVTLSSGGTITVWQVPRTAMGQTSGGAVIAAGGLAGISAAAPHAQGTGQLRFDTSDGTAWYVVRISSNAEVSGRIACRWPFPGQQDTLTIESGAWNEFTAVQTGHEIGKAWWSYSTLGVTEDCPFTSVDNGVTTTGNSPSVNIGVTYSNGLNYSERQKVFHFTSAAIAAAFDATSPPPQKYYAGAYDAAVGSGIPVARWNSRSTVYESGSSFRTGVYLAALPGINAPTSNPFTAGLVAEGTGFQNDPSGTSLIGPWTGEDAPSYLFAGARIDVAVWGTLRLGESPTAMGGHDLQSFGRITAEYDVPRWRTAVFYLTSGPWEPPPPSGGSTGRFSTGFPVGIYDQWTNPIDLNINWPGWDPGIGFDPLIPERRLLRMTKAMVTARSEMLLPVADPLSAPDFPDPWAGDANGDRPQIPAGQGIRQERWVEFAMSPYLIAYGQALPRGKMAVSVSSCGRATATVDPVRLTASTATPGLQHRFRPDLQLVASPSWTWTADNGLELTGAVDRWPTLQAALTYQVAPEETLTRAALVFDGTDWMKITGWSSPLLTAVMVVRTHAGNGPFYGLLESERVASTDFLDDGVMGIGLRFSQDSVIVYLPTKAVTVPLPELMSRSYPSVPYVIALSIDVPNQVGRLMIVGASRATVSFALPTGYDAVDTGMYLGRAGGRLNPATMAQMELFELGIDLIEAMSFAAMEDTVSQLANAYGVGL